MQQCTYALTLYFFLWQGGTSEPASKFSDKWSNNQHTGHKLKVLRLYIPRQPRWNFFAEIGGNPRASVNYEGRFWKRLYARDVRPTETASCERWMSWRFLPMFIAATRRTSGARHLSTTMLDESDRGFWIVVGPGSEKSWQLGKWDNPDNPEGNWDRKILHIIDTTNLSTVAPGTTIFEESNLCQKGV